MMKTRLAILAAALALAACHNQPTAGGLSAEDERELDNAAAMLDQQNIFDDSAGAAANAADQAPPAGAANRAGNAQ
jgi:ABC-type glycerol-3-phosphate transport system substrate-binding protein